MDKFHCNANCEFEKAQQMDLKLKKNIVEIEVFEIIRMKISDHIISDQKKIVSGNIKFSRKEGSI